MIPTTVTGLYRLQRRLLCIYSLWQCKDLDYWVGKIGRKKMTLATTITKLGGLQKAGYHALNDSIRAKTWIIDGKERSSGQSLRVIWAGAEVDKNYMAHLIYGGDHESRFLGSKSPMALRRMASHANHDAALMIIEGLPVHRWLYATKEDFWVPRWLTTVADVPLVAASGSGKDDLRRVRSNALDYEITSELDRVADFYHSMYLPTTMNRHQDRTIATDLDGVMNRLCEGTCELLLVKKAGQAIAGGLILQEEKRPRLWLSGILNADPLYRKYGAAVGTYYLASIYLAEQGINSMHMGTSRPFFTDGVLAYKIKWKIRVQPGAVRGFLLKPLASSEALNSFLIANPFIRLQKNEPRATVFHKAEPDLSEKQTQALKKKYLLKGLSGLDVYRLSKDKGRWTRETALDRAGAVIARKNLKGTTREKRHAAV